MDAATDQAERVAAARTAIAILAASPQGSALGPKALQPRPPLTEQLIKRSSSSPADGAKPTPISYVELRDHFDWSGFTAKELFERRAPQRAPLPMSDLLRLRQRNQRRYRVRTPSRKNGRREWRAVNEQVRPGQGGRRPNSSPFDVNTATRELVESLGTPQVDRNRGAHIMVWDARDPACAAGVDNGVLDPEGDGVVFARLSGDEIQKGETIGYHVQAAIEAGKTDNRRILSVVASLNNSGYRNFDDRLDLLRVEEMLAQGDCAWLGVSFAHRLARGRLQIEEVYQLLREAKCDLYIGEIRRKVDWVADDTLLAGWSMVASLDGRQIKQRTHGAIIRRYLLEGRGWPGSIRFGTKRGPDLYLIEDCEQMKIVRWMFKRFIEICDANQGGLRELREEIKDVFGTTLSHERIRTILMDPLYVTGEWHVHYEGYPITCEPVEFSQPVAESTFQRVQELLSLRGRSNVITPLGHFLLNYVPFFHAPCMDEGVGGRSETPKLRGKLRSRHHKQSERYRHFPSAPKCCKGFFLPKGDIERTVILAIKKALRARVVRRAAARADAAGTQESPDTEVDTRRERHELEARLARIKSREIEAKRVWVDRFADEEAGPEVWQEMTSEIRAERLRLERQLAMLDNRTRRRRGRRPQIKDVDREGYLEIADAILTEETPEDQDHRIARAALVQALLSKVVLHEEDDGGYRLDLHGWIISDSEPSDEDPDPLAVIKGHLDRFNREGATALREDFRGDDDVGTSVKQGTACLTQEQTRVLVDFLLRDQRPPAELERYRVPDRPPLEQRMTLPDGIPAFTLVERLSAPMGARPARGRDDELVRLSALGDPRVLWGAINRGRLKATKLDALWYSTPAWLREYEESKTAARAAAARRGHKRRRRRHD